MLSPPGRRGVNAWRGATEGCRELIRLQEWLSFVGTELHKAVYVPLLDEDAVEAVKAYSVSKSTARLTWLAGKLDGREHLLGAFSVADALLFTVLNWSIVTPIDQSKWPPSPST